MEFERQDYRRQQWEAPDGLITVFIPRRRQGCRRGLLGRDHLSEGCGLLLPNSPLIHMRGMQFSLDLVFLSRSGHIAKVISAVPPGPGLYGAWARDCLELAAGESQRLGLLPGLKLQRPTPR